MIPAELPTPKSFAKGLEELARRLADAGKIRPQCGQISVEY